jgi:hypothetical protein
MLSDHAYLKPYLSVTSALELVDYALMSATKAGKKTSKEADEAFKKAVSKLGEYEKKCHGRETVAERIKTAEKVDKSSMMVLNSLMEKFRVREELVTLLHHTLTLIFSRWRRDSQQKSSFSSTSPFQIKLPLLQHVSADSSSLSLVVSELYLNLIPEVLCSRSNQNEILWNFSRFKDERRLTLKQNPHFYEVLPTSPKDYGDRFQMGPSESYLDMGRISVLSDNLGQAGRVFLKTVKTRAFGNAYDLGNAIIFKGSWVFFFIPFLT